MTTAIRSATDKRTERREDAFGELIHWQPERANATNTAWAKDQSRSGLAFMTSNDNVPGVGTKVHVNRERTSCEDDYRVMRVTPISKRLSLVGCCIASRTTGRRWWLDEPGAGNEATFGDGYDVLARIPPQRAGGTRRRDRRDCQRWLINRAVQWKVTDEQRAGAGYIVERSLRGLAIQTSQRDACHIGAHLQWTGEATRQWLGFHRAIVRRRKRTADGRYIIYLERID